MGIINLFSQLAGIIGIILSLTYLHRKKMKNILITKMLIDIVWGIHYILLGAFTGFFSNAIGLLREITFLYNKGKPKKYQLIIFVILNYITAWFTWSSAYSILPAIACTLATYSFWQKNPDRTRYIALLNNVLFFSYDVCVGSISGMVCEALSFLSILLALRLRRENKK